MSTGDPPRQLFEFPGGARRGFVLGAEISARENGPFLAGPTPCSTADNPAGGGTFFKTAFAVVFESAGVHREGSVSASSSCRYWRGTLPFAQELNDSPARRAIFRTTTHQREPHTFRPTNINGTWAPVRDIRFRANYSSQSVRVPTLSDLFTAGRSRTSRSSPTRATSANHRVPTGGVRQLNLPLRRAISRRASSTTQGGGPSSTGFFLLGQPEPDPKETSKKPGPVGHGDYAALAAGLQPDDRLLPDPRPQSESRCSGAQTILNPSATICRPSRTISSASC